MHRNFACMQISMQRLGQAESRLPNQVHSQYAHAQQDVHPMLHPSRLALLLQEAKPQQDYIMIIDADSILRMPFIPQQLGVTRGAALAPCRLLKLLDTASTQEHVFGHEPGVRHAWDHIELCASCIHSACAAVSPVLVRGAVL